jgi:hypothetical protein
VTPEQTVEIARDYEFLVLFTSTVGFNNDVVLARKIKEVKPDLKIAFVGPHVELKPDCLLTNPEIDFIVTGEFDYSVVEFAQGKPLSQIPGAGYRENGGIHLNPKRPQLQTEDLDPHCIVAACGPGVKPAPERAACSQTSRRGTIRRVITPLLVPRRCHPDSFSAINGPIHHCGSDGGENPSPRSRSATRTFARSNAVAKESAVAIPFWKKASPK